MNAMTEVTVLETQTLARVEGGAGYVSDDYCFRPLLPRPLLVSGPDPTPWIANVAQTALVR